MAQLDARPTDNQEVAGSIPAGSTTFFHGDLTVKFFLHSFSLPLIQEGQLSVSGERAGLGGSIGCAVRLETRRSQVHSLPRLATFFHGD